MWTIAWAHVSIKNGKMEDKEGQMFNQKILFLKMKTIPMCLRCNDHVPGPRGTLGFTDPGLFHCVQAIVNTSANQNLLPYLSSLNPHPLLWVIMNQLWKLLNPEEYPFNYSHVCRRVSSEMAIALSLYFSLFLSAERYSIFTGVPRNLCKGICMLLGGVKTIKIWVQSTQCGFRL